MKDMKPQTTNSIEISAERHFSGPLPRPEDLEKYDKVVPGAAERIIKMAEEEMRHRHENDNRLSKGIMRTTIMSIVFAFISVLILSSIVVYSLYKGYSTVAASIAVGSIAAVASVFIFFKSSSKSNKFN